MENVKKNNKKNNKNPKIARYKYLILYITDMLV